MSGNGLVTFVGAGPGDPELLTIAGKKAIASATLVLYAGSLVAREVAEFANASACIVDSSALTLAEAHALVKANAFAGQLTARVHTGDPSIFGALAEQTALLDADAIPWRVIPGVTAAMAAAAAAGISFSLPEIAQSLIITRLEGRTPMPANENLADLARHGASMAIYLAAKMAPKLQAELEKSLPPDTPVICASRASWADQKIIFTQLGELARTAAENGLDKQTIFLVLPSLGKNAPPSRLYSSQFTHSFRKGETWTSS